jgi:hypothetical protein
MNASCLVVALSVFTLSVHAQVLRTKQKVITIIQERAIYLNGGARATVGGKSRETIKIDLPRNTTGWYYGFTTTPGESGMANLNLAIQLGALAMDPIGLTKAALEKINVPNGSASIDVYTLDQNNSDLFMAKVDLNGGSYSYFRDGTVLNTRSGVIQIAQITGNTVYLGLKNPSTFDGINIKLEVVAITLEQEQMSDQESEAITIGNFAWKAFERGDYDRCLELSNKAIAMDETLGYVHFNIGLTLLMKGLNSDALDAYTKAITVTRKTSIPKQTFEGAIKDLETYMAKFPSPADAHDILAILQNEL